jgi:hypothetical protein
MLNSIRENEGDNAATTATSTPTIEFTATNTTNSIVSTATVLAELDMPSPITDDRIEMMNIVVVIDTLPMYIPT